MAHAKISIHITGPDDNKIPNGFIKTTNRFATFARTRDYHPVVLPVEAKRDEVLAAFSWVTSNLVADGQCLVSYCGHGLPSGTACAEKDKEVWKLFKWSPSEQAVLGLIFGGFKATQRVVLINDSCYSGGFGALEKLNKFLKTLSQKSLGHLKQKQVKYGLKKLSAEHFSGLEVADLKLLADDIKASDCQAPLPTCDLLNIASGERGKTVTKAAFMRTLLALMTSPSPPLTYRALIDEARVRLAPQQPRPINASDAQLDRSPFP